MFVTMRQMVVKEGNADKVVDRFSKKGKMEEREGLVDVTVMKQKTRRGEAESVIVMTRWESEKHWKQWQQSDAHIAGHQAKRGKPKPDYFISSKSDRYEIIAVKEGAER